MLNFAVKKACKKHPEWVDLLDKVALERKPIVQQAMVCLAFRLAGPDLSFGPHPLIVSRWILGEHPTKLAEGYLNKREASAWIRQSRYRNPLDWQWAQMGLVDVRRPDSVEVTQWALRALACPERNAALRRDRAGMAGEGAYLKRLDELTPADLVAESVETVFSAATTRRMREMWSGDPILCETPRWAESLPSGVSVLTMAEELICEGMEMRHCVGDYCGRVSNGECHILSIRVGDERSTAEVSPRGEIRQHVGSRNSSPSAACIKLLNQALKLIVW